MRTLKELRDNIGETARESAIDDLIDEYINITLMEINNPSWAYEQIGVRGYHHNWSFNRRKHSFSTVATTEDYMLPRDLDKVGLIRQEETPVKLKHLPDEVFYRLVPKPSDSSGNPRWYRIWEEEGVSARLTATDKITVKSSSTSDTSSITVSISGYDSNGIKMSESLSLDGTSNVDSTITWLADRPLRISKSGVTVGDITVEDYLGNIGTLLILGKQERSPRFKVIGLYPIPDAAITVYLEYYTRIKRLVNAADVPDIDEKWIYVVRLGALAKVRDYQNKPDAAAYQKLFADSVRSMVKADISEVDYIPHLTRQHAVGQGFIDRMLGDWSLTES